jgi:hypothetical protein
MVDGRCTNSARLSAMASATFSAVAFSPLQKKIYYTEIKHFMAFVRL